MAEQSREKWVYDVTHEMLDTLEKSGMEITEPIANFARSLATGLDGVMELFKDLRIPGPNDGEDDDGRR